ncbi:MAG: hypothetical protein QXS81_04330, partial [Candidatus Micrarchaeaceae archaeon]
MTTQKQKHSDLFAATTFFVVAFLMFVLLIVGQPQYVPLTKYTETINMNTNSSGILTINMTFSNYTIVKASR